ncbi:unnamed protein product [Phytophthora fragariaefolia]|uniref:Unnamed protein product n=1 Tax=Phytophthora fragariaefolia TaxID=1490495 RepID=A0A9W6XA55_9STRA|nr:unnamed protein product [Phytophthora fragariaefolia]
MVPVTSTAPKRPREDFAAPDPNSTPPSKRRPAPVDLGGGRSVSDPANRGGEIDDDGGQVSENHEEDGDSVSNEATTRGGTGPSAEGEDAETADVADKLFEAQTLEAFSQSRSAERRRQHASPSRKSSAGGSGGPPGGSDDSDSGDGSDPRGHDRDPATPPCPITRWPPWIPLPPVTSVSLVGAGALMSYWESTHSFPIMDPAVRREPWLGVYRKERNNRRSHAGRRWKAVLELLIVATREGWCDLDILLDPFFLHFPKRAEMLTWYPGVDSHQANLSDPNLHRPEPTDLLEALDECNAEDPWRNHYRDTPQDHPARQITRIPAKFYNMHAVGDA